MMTSTADFINFSMRSMNSDSLVERCSLKESNNKKTHRSSWIWIITVHLSIKKFLMMWALRELIISGITKFKCTHSWHLIPCLWASDGSKINMNAELLSILFKLIPSPRSLGVVEESLRIVWVIIIWTEIRYKKSSGPGRICQIKRFPILLMFFNRKFLFHLWI